MPWHVLVTDNYLAQHGGTMPSVTEFTTLEVATEYARRRTRASVEELRSPGKTPETLRSDFLLFGESSTVVVDERRVYNAADELDDFVAHPAGEDERDWLSLEPDAPVDGRKSDA